MLRGRSTRHACSHQIVSFLDEEAAFRGGANSAWVVQRYLTNPLLIRGGRKFDLRVWVLLDAEYSIVVAAHTDALEHWCSQKATFDNGGGK